MPIGALPIDLQIEVQQTSSPVRRVGGGKPRKPDATLLVTAAALLAIALGHAWVFDEVSGFESKVRTGSLLGGALLGAYHMARVRAQGFRSWRGQQLVLGSASVVVVDTQSVRVIPGEHLTFANEELKHGNELLYDARADSLRWRNRLRDVLEEARSSAAAGRKDRYRQAARRARMLSLAALWWSRRGTMVIALGAALCAAVFVEAGPLHQRALTRRTQRARASEIATSARALGARRSHDIHAVATAIHEENKRKARDRRLAAASSGGIDEARAFLVAHGNDEERPRVQARLRALCAAKLPGGRPGEPPRTRMLRAVLVGACETPDGHVYYTAAGGADAEVAGKVVDAAAADARRLAPGTPLHTSPTAVVGYPHVRVTTRKIGPGLALRGGRRLQAWAVELTPIDAAGQPVSGATFLTTHTSVVPL
ncbi:hypothetical protein [Sorangium sp. So ce861]|uniref:hypothetical protein n=1 Tax=Sorangium sp. So ce861 TaxID=3133323 RepID=UPI003F5DC7B6